MMESALKSKEGDECWHGGMINDDENLRFAQTQIQHLAIVKCTQTPYQSRGGLLEYVERVTQEGGKLSDVWALESHPLRLYARGIVKTKCGPNLQLRRDDDLP